MGAPILEESPVRVKSTTRMESPAPRHASSGGGRHPVARGGLLAGLMAFLVLGTLTVIWSLSVPLVSAPDESHHVVKAAAVVRGEWLGVQATGRGTNVATMKVYVPATYAHGLGNFDCYRERADNPVSCAPPLAASASIVPAETHVGRYPPLYYLLVGWPSLLSTAASSIRWMRVLSCLINSFVLAWAFALIRRYRMGVGALVGLCCAVTPVAIYMDSTVQPNGLEVSLGIVIAVAIIGLAQFVERARGAAPADLSRPRPPRMLVNVLGACASTLVLVRGLSPLWLGCLALLALILIPFRSWWGWLRLAQFRIWLGVLVVTSLLALAWIKGAHALQIQPWAHSRLVNHDWLHVGRLREVQIVIGRSGWFVEQMVGSLTKDAHIGVGGYIGAFIGLALLLIAGFVRGSARERLALSYLVLAVLLIPVALAAPRVRQDGLNWQGRYILPFAASIVIVAGAAAFRRRVVVPGAVERAPRPVLRRRMAALLITGALLLQGVEFWSALRRYTVTDRGTHNLLTLSHPNWSPVLPVGIVAAGVPLLLLVGAILLIRMSVTSEPEGAGTAAPVPATPA